MPPYCGAKRSASILHVCQSTKNKPFLIVVCDSVSVAKIFTLQPCVNVLRQIRDSITLVLSPIFLFCAADSRTMQNKIFKCPFVAPLSFGSLSCCPSASTPISLQLCLVPWPPPLVDPSLVTAFGVVCRRSRRHIRPVQRHLPQSGRPPNITLSGVVAARVRRQRRAYFAVAVAVGILTRVRYQRGVSPVVACHACPSPGRDPEEGASPSQ